MTDVVMGEPKKSMAIDNQSEVITKKVKDGFVKGMVLDEPVVTPGGGVSDRPLKYDDEDGSLEKDKALQTHMIPDNDSRWVVLDANGGLKKLVLKEGHGDSPDGGEKVSCHYSGFLRSNGEMFDSSRERGDLFTFEIGKGSVIKGWDQGIATMEVGERAILRCSSEFAYGEKGSEPKIPPGATLDFIVELEDITKYEPVWGTDDAKDSITKKTVKKVEGWETAEKLWVVTVTYTGRENDENGRIWCSGKDEEIKMPFDEEFEGNGVAPEYEQPRGFYVCLRNTKEGEQNFFKLKSTDFYTFGSTGSEKYKIAPNTDLFYDMTITAMKKFKINSWDLNEEEKLPKAMEMKGIANDFFRRKKLTVANRIYKDVLDLTEALKKDEKLVEDANAISLACYSNKALVETQLNNLSEAFEQIEKGLEIDPKHEKLRYRKALIYFKRGEFVPASDLLVELGNEFPENTSVKSLRVKNERANKAAKRKARKLAKKMFGPGAAKRLKKCVTAGSDGVGEGGEKKSENADGVGEGEEKKSENADGVGEGEEKKSENAEKDTAEKMDEDDAEKDTAEKMDEDEVGASKEGTDGVALPKTQNEGTGN